VTQIKYNRDGDLLFSAARDSTPNVWFSHNGERLGTYAGHNGAVFSLDVNFNSTRLITASADLTAKLWDVETGKELFNFDFESPVRTVEYGLGDKEMLVVTDAKMGKPATLSVFDMASSIGSRTFDLKICLLVCR
jgi:translation initiation factor 3 subunit I